MSSLGFVLTSCQGPRVWRACPMAMSMLRLGDSPAGVAPTRFRESAEHWVNVVHRAAPARVTSPPTRRLSFLETLRENIVVIRSFPFGCTTDHVDAVISTSSYREAGNCGVVWR